LTCEHKTLGDTVDAGGGCLCWVRFPVIALADNEKLAIGDARSDLARCREKVRKAFSFRRQPADKTNNTRAMFQTQFGTEPRYIPRADSVRIELRQIDAVAKKLNLLSAANVFTYRYFNVFSVWERMQLEQVAASFSNRR
jgi:hypothetical protein